MNDQQRYFEYDQTQPNWWLKEPPFENPKFQEGLTELAGLNPFGEPNLRVSWAGKLMHDITEHPQLKYKLTASVVTGYRYQAVDGKIKIAKSRNEAKDMSPGSFFIPRREAIPVGRLRWVIELWESAESLRKKGRFTKLHDDSGKKILRDLPPEGVYNHYFWVETRDKKFRDLDPEVLTAIQAMWLYQINTSEAQQALDDIERAKRETLIGAEEANSIWAEMGG